MTTFVLFMHNTLIVALFMGKPLELLMGREDAEDVLIM